MTAKDLRTILERKKGKKEQIVSTISLLRKELRKKRNSIKKHEKAREIVHIVGLKTQKKLTFHISDITSLALDSIFDNPYELKVTFVQRRNKAECDLTFVRDDMEIDPIEASGVGAIDVAAFALRIASWSMMRPKSRNVIILDEPFKFLSKNYQERASNMIKELSQKLGLQFIIVTHEEILTSAADRTFEVSIKKGVTKIKQI